jgi:hypothetical protein
MKAENRLHADAAKRGNLVNSRLTSFPGLGVSVWSQIAILIPWSSSF